MPKEPQGCLFGWLAALLGNGGGPAAGDARNLPAVMVSNRFLSEAEKAFFRTLRTVVGDQAHILAQVSLRQLLYLPQQEGRQAWQNRVAQKAVDFVLLHPATLAPLVVIELDDTSHTRAERQTRDELVEDLCTAAGLPLLHVTAGRGYNVQELRQHLSGVLRR